MHKKQVTACICLLVILNIFAFSQQTNDSKVPPDQNLRYTKQIAKPGDLIISRTEYANRLQGFWLGQCIANWTGIITENLKQKAPFYTDDDWGKPHGRRKWQNGKRIGEGQIIDFFLVKEGEYWSADDDTDIEYIFQELLDKHNVSMATPEMIRDAWLKHIKHEEENYLWVSNQKAFDLMKQGLLPPDTSLPKHNHLYDMIDAQLTTEIFGLFAPAHPDVALNMAHLPIRTTAYAEAEWISEFYVIMHSLASWVDRRLSMQDQTVWLAEQARKRLPQKSVAAHIYDYIKADYEANADKSNWEKTRDAVYQRYQIEQEDGHVYKSGVEACINYAAGMVSLFYGEGDYKRTIQIGTLCGWDSDNPTATWGGLLGFMLGLEGVKAQFPDIELSGAYNISSRRINFPDRTPHQTGDDSFKLMAQRGIHIIDRVILEEMKGGIDLKQDLWIIPNPHAKITRAKYVKVKHQPKKNQHLDISSDVNKFAPGWSIKDCGAEENPGLRNQYRGNKNILVTHPLNQNTPCTLSKKIKVPKSPQTTLRIKVTHDPRGDWMLVIKVNGKTVTEQTISKDTVTTDGWKTISLDLSKHAGNTVNLDLQNKPTGWFFETGFWGNIEILNGP